MASQYRLKIAYSDLQFEAEGDKKFVLDMWKKFQDRLMLTEGKVFDKKKLKRISGQDIKWQTKDKGISVGEFIRQLGFKKHTDFVLAFGYHLEKFQGMKEFGPADINRCYYDAKMEGSNTSQMIVQNIKHGRMMEAKGRKKKGQKQYTLTRTGEDFIEKASGKKKDT